MKRMFVVMSTLFFFGLSSVTAIAFTIIPNPDATYLGETTYIDFSSVPNFTAITSVSDGFLTVGFSGTADKRTAEGGGWATWSATPFSQRTTPGAQDLPVAFFTGQTSVDLTLSTPVGIFGFEGEPNPFAVHDMTATFYDESLVLLGSITQSVDGLSGARLFAAAADPIKFVNFSSDVDFAIGAFRYAQPIPEPATMILIGSGLLGLAGLRRKFKM